MKLAPTSDRIIIKPAEALTKSAGGIIIPDTNKERPKKGEVVAVGPGKVESGVLVPMETQIGNVVLYGKFTGSEIIIDGQDYLIMRESDVIAIEV